MPKRNLIWLAAVALAALAVLALTRSPRHIIYDAPRADSDPLAEACRTIRDRYLYPIEDDRLRRKAVEAMIAQLDEYSTYVPPERAQVFADRMAGQAWGLGLKVEIVGGEAVVIGPLADSPAQHAGLLPGDRILQIDGRDVRGLSRRAVEDLLDDPNQPSTTLRVRHVRGREQVLTCRRGRYALQTVQGLCRDVAGRWVHVLDGNEGLVYLRIREVLPDTPEHLRATLRQIGRPRTIVLDLRDNPGGDLLAAVELANMFIPRGMLVRVVDRAGQTDHAAFPAHCAVEEGVDVVALIDQRTASAAEMIAGALAGRDRAVLVGVRTLGKGCIQSMIPLAGGLGRINLTTAEFFVDPPRPIQRHRDANVWGVDPHVWVDVPAELAARLAVLRTRGEVVHPRQDEDDGPDAPASSSRAASFPATAAVLEDVRQSLLALDPALRAAIGLAGRPAEMKLILRRSAEARAAAQTRPAATQTRPAARE